MVRGETGLESSIATALAGDKWQAVSGENQESVIKFCIKSENVEGSEQRELSGILLTKFFDFGEYWLLKSQLTVFSI